MRVGDRLGGHIVQGHVDGVGTLRSIRPSGEYTFLEYEVPAALVRYLIPKGSIAIDGVSLTVNDIEGARFRVAIIPHTAEVTHLTRKRAGDPVNLEADMLAKHVERLLVAFTGGKEEAGLSLERLAELGLLDR